MEELNGQRENITKIQAGERISFVRIRPDRPTEFVYVEFREDPRPEFNLALQALVPVLIEQCGLIEAVWQDAEIKMVSFNHCTLNTLGFAATIQLRREMKSPLTQGLPYVPADEIDEKLQLKLKTLIDEAWLYIKGDRRLKQTSLFEPQEKETAA